MSLNGKFPKKLIFFVAFGAEKYVTGHPKSPPFRWSLPPYLISDLYELNFSTGFIGVNDEDMRLIETVKGC